MIEAQWLWSVLLSFGFGGVLAGGIVYLLCTRWLSSYLNKKGENLATKEDVQQITALVKGVEHKYNVLIEEMKAKQQLRMAALEKRLQAHQEAFTMCKKLIGERTEGEQHPVLQCQDWWNKNCLYLEPEVRQAFSNAYHGASLREQLLASRSSGEHIKEAWQDMMAFPKVLFETIKLPGLSPTEEASVQQPSVTQ